MNTHELKTVQPFFDEVMAGRKKFEFRKNDREFKTGDILILKEYDKEKDEYSGREIKVRVDYILENYYSFDLQDFCIMSVSSLDSVQELIDLRQMKQEYLSVTPRLEKFAELKGHWSTILFIPQDLGFEHQTQKPKGHHTMDIFHKDGFATTKGADGLWIVQQGDNTMKFKINNKLEAFVIFNALGLKLDQRTDFELITEEEE